MFVAGTRRNGHLFSLGLLLAIGLVASFAMAEEQRLPIQPPSVDAPRNSVGPRIYRADAVPTYAPWGSETIRAAATEVEPVTVAESTDPPAGVPTRAPEAPATTTVPTEQAPIDTAPSQAVAAPAPAATTVAVEAEPEEDRPLEPIPDSQLGEPVAIEAASFNGVTPGITSREELKKLWGEPKQAGRHGEFEAYLYAMDPFEQIEVTFSADKVSSVVIRLAKPFPAKVVTEQLELTRIQPVLVSSELGEILGEAFPERGVLFSFEPTEEKGKTTMSVLQIILEPISAEAFSLRAETNLDTDPDSALADLDQSLKLGPGDARAHWLRAKILMGKGQAAKAAEAAAQAATIDPVNSHYQLTYAQVLNQSGKYAEAVAAAKNVLESKDRREHVKAQALCLLGDLAATGPEHDYRTAMAYHAEAIKTADPLATSPHPAIRLAAKEVLIDAHLGAASDIAWGKWKQKEAAVSKWLGRASAFADEMIANDGGNNQQRFRVAVRALSTYVGLQGKLDPTDWTKQAIEVGDQLIASTKDPVRKEQINWDLGMALYDAVQVYQVRGDDDKALECGQQAITRLEQGGTEKRNTLAYAYLLGRVQFRLGAIYAVSRSDHKAAVAWFDKAVPLLSKPVPEEALADLGRHGETFVSMAVSYWETGQQDKALRLTQQGAALMEQAVKNGTADRSILSVPYSNLATMHRALGEKSRAEQWAEMAAKSKDTIQK